MNYAARKVPGPHDARCSVDGCTKKIHSKRMCVTHYNADYRRRNDNAISNEHAGVVKVGIKGWGSIA